MISRIKRHPWRAVAAGAVAAGVVAAGCLAIPAQADPSDNTATTTPIKHVVVIFSENVSFDHYFATYPNAANTDGTHFVAAANTPKDINTLANPQGVPAGTDLLTHNPNLYQPTRLTHDEAWTTSQNHNYTPEQKAVDGGQMDKFNENTSAVASPAQVAAGQTGPTGIVMDYYDGNTVTGLWNYAQNYAMSDNSWDAQFGPSTVGAVNLISGQTGGAVIYKQDDTTNPVADPSGAASGVSAVSNGVGTIIGDPEPAYDDCANNDHTRAGNPDVAALQSSNKNVGDLLNAKGITWGWFQGGFTPTTPWDGQAGHYAKCDSASLHYGSTTSLVTDYSPHHDPFEYYKSTSNPHHLPPTSLAAVGTTDQANHQYDLSYFNDALAAGKLPAVSFLKAPAAQDGHPSNSTPLDEQKFMTTEINALEQSPEWASTAVVISYDDSDGWYDHVAPVIKNASNTSDDDAICTAAAAGGVNILTTDGTANGTKIEDRCGPSQRLPLLVISPYSKKNYVDHTETDQSSILKFIEDNWNLGKIGGGSLDATAGSLNGMFDFAKPQTHTVLLSPTTGAVLANGVSNVPSTTTTTKVKTSKATQVYGTAVPAKLTATVAGGTGKVAGSVSFYAGSTLLSKKTLVGGSASYTLPKTESVATHSFTAKFASSNPALASNSASSALKVKVVKATATTGIAYSKGKIVVTVKANTKLTVNGTAKVYDGKKVIKTLKVVKGRGGFAVKLKKGTHKLHAVFATTKTITSDASKTISVKIAK